MYHVTAAYPNPPVHQGDAQVYLPNGYPVEHTAIRKMWQKHMKHWHKDTNMNTTLVNRFLSLLPQEYRNLYINTLI